MNIATASVSSGWYVNRKDLLDVVFVTEEIDTATRRQIGRHYQGLERGRVARRKEISVNFRRHYKPIDPRVHAGKLFDYGLSALTEFELIRDDIDPKPEPED